MIKREYYKYNDFGPRNGSTFERICLEFESNVRPVVYNPPPRLFLNSFRGSRSSSKLVRDEAYPPRPFIRSKSVGDPDEDEGDPVAGIGLCPCVPIPLSPLRKWWYIWYIHV